jgi:Ribonuclease G/E
MIKELFVSSTPHETKVGLVEDDLLAEIYLERENEYTLAGSIYKGRVTRVLPGMQSAFVDIGLERDAFLYVSDFMELEDQDEDLTDIVPANRGVRDMRQPAPRQESITGIEPPSTAEAGAPGGIVEHSLGNDIGQGEIPAGSQTSAPPSSTSESRSAGDSQERERGGWRGRRRRRGGRRDGRGDGRNDARGEVRSEGRDRGPESRYSRSSNEPSSVRTSESGRSQQFGPPAGYQPILLPGESISKYQRLAQSPARQEQRPPEAADLASGAAAQPATAAAATFPEDEPFFASGAAVAEPLHEQHDDSRVGPEEASEAAPTEAASSALDWNAEFRRPDLIIGRNASPVAESEIANEEDFVEEVEETNTLNPLPEYSDRAVPVSAESQTPVFAVPGTLEEETIDEEEADTIRYQESSDDSYEEFEEETRAPGQLSPEISQARETVSEIHRSSLAEAGQLPAEGSPAEGEDDSEELELEEAQAEAEALLDAEARGSDAGDARAEVRAPAATAGYTQRTQRPRPGFDRQGGQRGRRGGRRFRRHENQDVPKISDLLKEGQEILVQIAKEPIGKKGARITSHIALPGRFLVYMPTVNHTGVSRKIASDEERQRLKRIVLSERDNGHGGFIVRTAAQSATEDELRADIRFLKGLWNDIKGRSESSKPPALIYHDLNVVERVLRDQVTSDFSVIWVDTEPEYERILRFFNRFQPALVKRVKLYTKDTPLFEQFGLAEEMNKALKSKVWL